MQRNVKLQAFHWQALTVWSTWRRSRGPPGSSSFLRRFAVDGAAKAAGQDVLGLMLFISLQDVAVRTEIEAW